MKIHVFASDILPLQNLSSSVGGLRSWQLIAGLRDFGFTVTYSIPRATFLYKLNEASITAEDRAMSWTEDNQNEILDGVRPHIAVWCNPLAFSLPSGYRSDCMFIVDLDGPMNIESSDILGKGIKDTTKRLIDKLSCFDHYITVCNEQRYYFASLIRAAGVPEHDINISLVPISIPRKRKIKRRISDDFSMIFCGGFYPWQDPYQIVMSTGRILDDLDRGTLHVYGSPHTSISKGRIEVLMSKLSKMRRVRFHGYVKREELISRYETAACALDLMPRSLERELTVTTRSVEYLAYGLPPIYDNYAPLAKHISKYDAGWCLDPHDINSYGKFLRTLISKPKTEFADKSQNALELSLEEFSLEKTMSPLVQVCGEPRIRATRINNRPLSRLRAIKRQPRIAVFTQDDFAVKQVRVVHPLDAMKRAGLVAGYTIFLNREEQGPDFFDAYDGIWIQRSMMGSIVKLVDGRPFLFDIDDLLIGNPAYTKIPLFQARIIKSLLSRKCVLSVPNKRLHGLLKKYAETKITNDVFITPNGIDFPKAQMASDLKPTALIWTSSDAAALTTSYDDVLGAIDEFSDRRQLPVYLVGRFDMKSIQRTPKNTILLGMMDYWHYKSFLASQPSMIGICPLETHADECTLDFIASKSDVKMVEYGGFGHPGVYSKSPPYEQSDLKAGVLTLNTTEGWKESLEYTYGSGYKRAAHEAKDIRELRQMDRLAVENWFPAVKEIILQKPVSRAEIIAAANSSGRFAYFNHEAKGKGRLRRKAVLLFGAGSGGEQTYFSLPKNFRCVAFVDNDIKKHRTTFLGKQVIAPSEISNYNYDSIIISSIYADDIERQLLDMNIEAGKIERVFI